LRLLKESVGRGYWYHEKNRKDRTVKQTLLEIKRKTTITTKAIAEQARLPIADVFTVETGGFCSTENAQRVITAFNQRSFLQVRLEDIALHPIAQSLIPIRNLWYNEENRSKNGT
jgi:hypothetical protein